MKITIHIELEPNGGALGHVERSHVTFEASKGQVPTRSRWTTADDAGVASDALNGLVKDARSWIDARKRGAR